MSEVQGHVQNQFLMRKILIVDDSMYMRALIKKILANAGYTIVGEAADGKSALELTADLNPDIITLDNVLPDMLGLDAIVKIKEHSSDIKVLMISPMGQSKIVNEALSNGIDDYLLKPFSADQIVEKVKLLYDLDNKPKSVKYG